MIGSDPSHCKSVIFGKLLVVEAIHEMLHRVQPRKRPTRVQITTRRKSIKHPHSKERYIFCSGRTISHVVEQFSEAAIELPVHRGQFDDDREMVPIENTADSGWLIRGCIVEHPLISNRSEEHTSELQSLMRS